uniref:F-box domain-containing protein n=1 Tax=Solanum lycopersicum TaxID=4081 RepID=A0A3Q7G6I8_SOLLC
MVGRRQLPKDLLVEVLLWLPVESLVRFKCVSKHCS